MEYRCFLRPEKWDDIWRAVIDGRLSLWKCYCKSGFTSESMDLFFNSWVLDYCMNNLHTKHLWRQNLLQSLGRQIQVPPQCPILSFYLCMMSLTVYPGPDYSALVLSLTVSLLPAYGGLVLSLHCSLSSVHIHSRSVICRRNRVTCDPCWGLAAL